MGVVTGLRLVDVIPLSDSSETNNNSEPSVAVDPLNTNEIVAGGLGLFSGSVSLGNPYFISVDGGTTWSPYGELDHNDKTLAWSPDGSTLFTTTLHAPCSWRTSVAKTEIACTDPQYRICPNASPGCGLTPARIPLSAFAFFPPID